MATSTRVSRGTALRDSPLLSVVDAIESVVDAIESVVDAIESVVDAIESVVDPIESVVDPIVVVDSVVDSVVESVFVVTVVSTGFIVDTVVFPGKSVVLKIGSIVAEPKSPDPDPDPDPDPSMVGSIGADFSLEFLLCILISSDDFRDSGNGRSRSEVEDNPTSSKIIRAFIFNLKLQSLVN